jgi:hypothetical protein
MIKLRDLYKKAVSTGIENDPRGREAVQKYLEVKKKDYDALKDKDKEFFDTESLENPYADSRILNGTGEEEINTALIGVDIEVPELLLAHALNSKGRKIDLVIAHHPEGRPFANLYQVMGMQADILGRFGVPINIAEDLMEGRIREVERRLLPVNHTRAVDAARLLGLPFMCLHTVADNMVSTYLEKLFEDKKPYTLDDIMDLLMDIPEYRQGKMNGAGPKLLLGGGKRKAGKIYVDMTGGTEGSKDIFESMASSGIGTLIQMHLSDEHRKEAEKHHINVIIAGHISSDTLGLNLLFDQVQKAGSFEILECSGFKRIPR